MPNKLKGYRVMAGYTQKDMAEALGINKITYSLKESGKNDFTLTEMKKAYEVLHEKINTITFEDIFF